MAWSKPEPEYADEVVWQCTECICWSRQEFVSELKPHCSICGAKMIEQTRNIRIK